MVRGGCHFLIVTVLIIHVSGEKKPNPNNELNSHFGGNESKYHVRGKWKISQSGG